MVWNLGNGISGYEHSCTKLSIHDQWQVSSQQGIPEGLWFLEFPEEDRRWLVWDF